MRVRLTCQWRSSRATQEEVPVGQPIPWGAAGAVVEGELLRLRQGGYAPAQSTDLVLARGKCVAVLRDDGSRVRTGPVENWGQVKGGIELHTDTGRYLLEVLKAPPPVRRGR